VIAVVAPEAVATEMFEIEVPISVVAVVMFVRPALAERRPPTTIPALACESSLTVPR
jgi:hypothetical protein